MRFPSSPKLARKDLEVQTVLTALKQERSLRTQSPGSGALTPYRTFVGTTQLDRIGPHPLSCDPTLRKPAFLRLPAPLTTVPDTHTRFSRPVHSTALPPRLAP